MEEKYSKWQSSSRGRGTTSTYRSRSNYQSDDNGYRRERNYVSDNRYNNHEGTTERPRFSDYRSNRPEGARTGSRPRIQQNPNGIRAERVNDYRPRYNAEDNNGFRPRRNQEDGGFRPRYNNAEDKGGFRPRQRFSRDNNTRPQGSVYTKRKQQEYQQRYTDPAKPMRLNKYLANAGICSRREADDFIQAGVITVNGEVVTTLGAKVMPTDRVMFHDQSIRRESKVYILLNKPKNCVTTTDDPQGRKTVLDIVKNACAERIYPVGRLDRNTTGVLLLTNDGDLAAKLTHPKFGKKKVYAATLDKDLTPDDFATIMQGVVLDDELIVPDALEFTKEGDHRHIGLEIHSGQNRVVRRIFEKVGYKVMQLDRVSFAGLTKKNVSRGKYRFLSPKEVSMLQMGAFD